MIKGKFPFKRWIIKCILNAISFAIIIFILVFSKLPEKFDSYVYYEDFKVDSWGWLLIYRFSIYFVYPFVVSSIEGFIASRKCVPFIYRLLENFNIQFLTYTIISAFYALFGIDKILGVNIFSSSDSFMFIGSFILTLLINKSLPNLFYDSNKDNISYDRKVYDKVDLNSIRHDSNPFSNARNYLSYEYNNITGNNHLIVILKNPSKSFVNGVEPSKKNNCIDITTYNVMKTIDKLNQRNSSKQYKKVTILNLFPEFSTDPEMINKIYKFKPYEGIKPKTKCYKRMHKIIEKFDFADCDIIYAWGQNNYIYSKSYDIAIEQMKQHFRKCNTFEYDGENMIASKNDYPLHGLQWNREESKM